MHVIQGIESRTQDKPRLHVVCVLSNPMMYGRRWELAREFLTRMEREDIGLVVVEHAYGSRAFMLTEPLNPNHVQVRGNDDLWIKESLIRIGMSHLPMDWEKVAWIDMDVTFLNPHWVHDTLHALERYKVVQLFETAIDLGPRGEVMQVMDGFACSWSLGRPRRSPGWKYPYGDRAAGSFAFHPGFAWAARRSAINDLGGLIDWAVLGSADNAMALCLIGAGADAVPPGLHPNYARMTLDWQARADRYIDGSIGSVPGTIAHYWHGRKARRQYGERWKILRDNAFDPMVDVKRGYNELVRLNGTKPQLRAQLVAYFAQRGEDGIDLD